MLHCCNDIFLYLWSFITSKRCNIEAYYLRSKRCARKDLSKDVCHGAAPPQGVSALIRNTLSFCNNFWSSQVWSSITFQRFKTEGYYLRWKCCLWKELSKNVWHGAVVPKGRPQMPNVLRFGGIFSCIPISRTSVPSPFSPHSLPLPLPFPISPRS